MSAARLAGRFALVLLGALVLALAAEGALSLVLGRSLRGLLDRREAPGEPLELERELAVAARATAGAFRAAEDPLVATTLELEGELTVRAHGLESRAASDGLGLRAPAPAPAAGEGEELRIVVLGGSLAFGLGLADEETLAARLEDVLAPALARAVRCTTVAVPGWNARNAWRFLLDHLDALRPALVLWLPAASDLEDSLGVDQDGEQAVIGDPCAAHPLLVVRPSASVWTRRVREAADGSAEHAGPAVLAAGLGESARLRWEDLARTLAHGAERLERTGTRFALVLAEDSDFERELCAELAQGEWAPAVIPLVDRLREDETLADGLPDAATVTLWARWIAESLGELGWLSAGALALPEPDESHAGRRARVLEAAEALEWSRERRARLEDELEPAIVPRELRGVRQVLGGLDGQARTGIELAAVLPRGRAVRVRLAPLDARPDLYPLEVRVHASERLLGVLRVPGDGPGEARFELGEAEAAAAFEVRLVALDWAVIPGDGAADVASAELLLLESEP